MSSLSEIRDAIKATLSGNITGLVCYDTIPDAPQVPCVVVAPVQGDFSGMNGNCVQWEFDLYVLTARGDSRTGQDKLDALIDGGAGSIRSAVKANPTLGLSDVNAHMVNVTDYGGEYRAAHIQHWGAKMSLRVLVTQ